MNEAVFIATLGAEPQVVTLALDALIAEGAPIARVEILHTRPDREPIHSALNRLRIELKTSRYTALEVVAHVLAGESGMLDDVTTPDEIDDAFHSLYTLIRYHKQAGRTVHLCIAGGRKTMALFAMAAAQILFRKGDCVWHLVSSPELIASKAFHAVRSDEVQLIPVPVARWMRPEEPSKTRDFLQHTLTPAEREVALAERLGKSHKTVANQLSSIYSKVAGYFGLDEPPDRAQFLAILGRYS